MGFFRFDINGEMRTLDDLHDQIAQCNARIEEEVRLAKDANECSCGSQSIMHGDNSTGWCEDCGRVYAYDSEDENIRWFNPRQDQCPENLQHKLYLIWDNEAVTEPWEKDDQPAT